MSYGKSDWLPWPVKDRKPTIGEEFDAGLFGNARVIEARENTATFEHGAVIMQPEVRLMFVERKSE